MTLQDKFSELEAGLEGELVERSEEIRCALLALVAGCSFFMVGPPGVAKSLLARRVALRISDAEFFDAQLDKMATPELLFGPWSLGAMRKNRWERELTGTLATAHLAHLDEIFAAGSALLQGLHWALNERIYRHGTTVVPIPLSTVFCSANVVPTDPGLAAFWDRLILRRVLSGDLDASSFARMMRSELADKPEPVLSWSEVTEAQVAARRIEVPDAVLDVAFRIRRHLADLGMFASPRRFKAAFGVVQASAWLDARDEATPTDLMCLKDMLWVLPDQAVMVAQAVDHELERTVSPVVLLEREVRRLRAQIQSGLPDASRLALAEELGLKLQRATEELVTIERHKSGPATLRCRRLIEDTNRDVLTLFRSSATG